MSRIGKKPIVLPAGVTVTLNGDVVEVKGPKGTLTYTKNSNIGVEVKENEVVLTRPNDSIVMKQMHGTTRALVHNMVVGVSEGFEKKLEINGIGYRAALRGTNLVLNMGYSHEVVIKPYEGVTITVTDPTHITVSGLNKQLVGQQASEIRAVREPEPYLGKGIKYVDEVILRKEGKRAGKK